MASHMINILLTSFPGLGLPATLSIPINSLTPITDLRQQLLKRLPCQDTRLTITTTSNKEIVYSNSPVSSLLPSEYDKFLPLRLSVPLCGGKGGFGSQLRAAGGRMSSRKKNNQGDINNSNRNLDGRRLRTVNEAKALAEYLALRPDMERKEKEARRKRWEQVVSLAERREDEIRHGSKGQINGKWVEDKDEAGERAREAVIVAMESGDYYDKFKESSSDGSGGKLGEYGDESEDEDAEKPIMSSEVTSSTPKPTTASVGSYLGFDEDEEFMSDDDEGEGVAEDASDDSSGKTLA